MQHLLIQMLFQLLSFYVWTKYHTFLIIHYTETGMNTGSCTKYESNFRCAKLHLQNCIYLLATLLFWNLNHKCFYIILAFNVQAIQI